MFHLISINIVSSLKKDINKSAASRIKEKFVSTINKNNIEDR